MLFEFEAKNKFQHVLHSLINLFIHVSMYTVHGYPQIMGGGVIIENIYPCLLVLHSLCLQTIASIGKI